MSVLILPFIGTLSLFTLVWPISVIRKDASLVDVLWGPGFGILAIATLLNHGCAAGTRDLVLVGLIVAWSLRLGVQLGGRRIAEGHEDARYKAIRAAWGPAFWWKSLFIVFVLQAVLQGAVAAGPLLALCTGDQSIRAFGWLAVALALAGIALETKADTELDRFKRRHNDGALCVSGLRAYLRHPNYLGEILFWTGVAGLCLDGGAVAGLAAPVLIGLFLTQVSGIPMLDERLSATRSDYAHYKSEVPALIPRLRPYTKPQ